MITNNELASAVSCLKAGKLIVLPTETVYALAGDATNLNAILQIFSLKRRPLNQPLSVLLAKEHPMTRWARDIPEVAEKLAERFWPGPLTLILKKEKTVLPELTGGQHKIGLRVPDHPIAQAVLSSFARGVAAPSANRSTALSPTHIKHVRAEFDQPLEWMIDGGPCRIGIESTIIDVTFTIPRILRLGALPLAKIASITPYEIEKSTSPSCFSKKPLITQVSKQVLDEVVDTNLNHCQPVTVFAFSPAKKKHKNVTWIQMPSEASRYGQQLYYYLHESKAMHHRILVEAVPKRNHWAGIQFILDQYS
ncbi:threonylcarbamoyl-AMP synthase [Rickettsiella grylli]|uniref:L-threonylcarbamoyladenylate synthase n=1 Tax=Rickettsiella grylli TaxID=59196 RepID=UPI0008FD8B03|nr:L-threonylcarbamoyladenylate synthase [Rickettsiella grylli]OIZ99741.1 threonylcarbamoyl-AMP synthase [Rickettsiella grylli]